MIKDRFLYDLSDGRHLCVQCRHYEDGMNTTQDWNDCSLFTLKEYKLFPVRCLCVSESGNDRLYSNGIVTEDNGGGYWVTRCPYYEKERGREE